LKVDIVILSYAKNIQLRGVTENALASLQASEDAKDIQFNTLVIESNGSLYPFTYINTTTIYPSGPFNFNRSLNIGLKASNNPYICFCNNDLMFHPHWASAILDQFNTDPELMSASPACSILHPTLNIMPNTGNYYGYNVREEIAGWCFFVKRELFDTIGLFDEHFKFWFADRDYAKTLQKFNCKHALVTSAIVDHLDGISTAELDAKDKAALTSEQYWYFQYKWQHNNILLYFYRMLRSKLRILNIKRV
jgi:GT2 family glycosyltransferase